MTMPLPMVAATFSWKMKMAMKLKAAAKSTACWGLSTPVDTTVAMEFAASWKPFMKSNARASATSSATTQKLTWTASMGETRPGSGVLEDDALDQVGDVFAAVGDRLELLVDGLELDELAHVLLLTEELGHRGAHHAVGVGLELVDLFAGLEGGFHHLGVAELGQQRHHVRDTLAALGRQVGQAHDLVGHAAHVVEGERLGGVLQQVEHVVHRVDQAVDLLAVDRRDEGLVQQAVHLGGDAVGLFLSVVHVHRVLLAQRVV